MKDQKTPIIFILSWNRPLYLWSCLDSIYRHTNIPCKIIIADNNSEDALVKSVINGFERRGMFHAVHLYKDNDPFRLKKIVEEYWDEIENYFVFIESDIEILPTQESCWLEKMLTYMEADPQLGIVGSRVYQADFIDKEEARMVEPDLSEEGINFLIKINAPMRKYQPTNEALISPHNPPLRLLMLRKSLYKKLALDVILNYTREL